MKGFFLLLIFGLLFFACLVKVYILPAEAINQIAFWLMAAGVLIAACIVTALLIETKPQDRS